MPMTPARRRDKVVIPEGSIIPQGDPDPADVEAAVAAVPELFRTRKTPLPPTMEETLPPGITEAPIPDPEVPLKVPEPTVMHQAQSLGVRPADETEPAFGTVTRFKEADLVELWWLRPVLERLFPRVSPNQWFSKLRSFMNQNNYLFIRNEHAVALAHLAHDEFGTDPYVMPIFVVNDEGYRNEALKLWRAMARWGKLAGASEVRDMTRHTDVIVSDLLRVPGAEKREEIVARLK